MLSNLVLELNNALVATFRFAAGQKSISADDLVVFAEMIYSVDSVLGAHESYYLFRIFNEQ